MTTLQADKIVSAGLEAFRSGRPRTPPPSSPQVTDAWLRGWDIGRCEAALGWIPTEAEFSDWLARTPFAGGAARALAYLACPYSHPDRAVRLNRFEAVNRAAAKLMAEGVYIFSPISHTHPILEAGSLPTGWEFWEGYDRTVLAACGRFILLELDGWHESKGVLAEIGIAREMGLTIERLPAGYGEGA